MPTQANPAQGHIDVALSLYAQKYRNTDLIGDMVSPRVGVNKQGSLYWTFGRENLQLPPTTLRAAGAAARHVIQTLSTNPYFTEDHALTRRLSDEERANHEPGAADAWAVRMVTDRLLLQHEDAIATVMQDSAQITAGVTLAGATQWSTAATSFPVQDVQTGHDAIVKAIGKRANVLILGHEVFSIVRNHADFLARVQNVKLGIMSKEDIASIFDVDVVLVGSAIKRTAAGVNSFVWGKHATLARIDLNASFEDLSAMKTFVWNEAPGSTGGFITETSRATPASRKSDDIDVHFYYDDKLVSAESAYLIEDAVA